MSIKMNQEVYAHIHSLEGKKDKVTLLEKIEDPKQPYYIVDYNGKKCTAIFNPFVWEYYADDLYGVIEE